MRSPPVRPLLMLSFLLVFSASLYSQDEPARTEAKTLEIKNVRLVAWKVEGRDKKRVEVHKLLETKPQHLLPSNRFDLVCEIVGGKYSSDYFVWTSVDFLVAPVIRSYDEMDDGTLGSSVAWGQVVEMLDLKATPIYDLRLGESRKVVLKGFDLSPMLAAFPVGDAGELWPWLIRVVVHLQDRSGKQLTSAECTLRLVPNSARKKTIYNLPMPSR